MMLSFHEGGKTNDYMWTLSVTMYAPLYRKGLKGVQIDMEMRPTDKGERHRQRNRMGKAKDAQESLACMETGWCGSC